ncbi:MAG: ABC transporter substrate-binding protein [Planctomycetaceae bacterium]|nr:ABC transporter substrate-binding protein [Planctomycetaceae bacterium]
MLVRKLLLVPLVVIIAWMIVAFFVVRNAHVVHKVDELTLGSIGEPDDLNPIISQTTAASEVAQFLFNGLLKYDQDFNVVGDLAEDYRITQTSTAFFNSDADAAAALDKLNAAKDRWAAMKLLAVKQDASRLLLQFGSATDRVTAGTSYEDDLFKIVDRKALRPVTVLTLEFDKDRKLPGGATADTENVKKLIAAVAGQTRAASLHEMIAVGESLLSVSVAGDTKAFAETLTRSFVMPLAQAAATQGAASLTADKPAETEEPAISIMESLDEALLNEPVFTFKLRKGVRWHDNQEVTAHDAAFTYYSIIDPKYRSPRASDYWTIKSVATPDDYTFVVTYRVPYTDCTSSWMMGLIPRHILEGKSGNWWADHFNSTPIGTGPYKNVEWVHNEYLKMQANEDYFEGPPNLKSFAYRILPDEFVNQVAFEARGFDVDGVRPDQVAEYKHNPRFRTFSRPADAYDYIGWNLKKPLFQDKRVRAALAYAVNVDNIIKYIYRGQARASNGPFPYHEWYGSPNLPTIPYDPEKAKALLAEAGWKDRDSDGYLVKDGKRFEFNLITNNGNALRLAIQVLVQSDLKKIGIKVNTSTYEWAAFIKNYINTQTFDACVLGWSLGKSVDQFQLWHSSMIKPPGLNFCSYNNKEVDALLSEIRTTFDRQKLTSLCQRMQKIVYDDQPFLFLSTPIPTTAIWKDQYVVRRPDGKGGWIVGPIENTPAGVTYYMQWWAPRSIAPNLKP